jgi:hypothetical protein
MTFEKYGEAGEGTERRSDLIFAFRLLPFNSHPAHPATSLRHSNFECQEGKLLNLSPYYPSGKNFREGIKPMDAKLL